MSVDSYRALRSALLRELAAAYREQAAVEQRVRELLAQIDQAQRDHAEDSRAASRERLMQYWSARWIGPKP